MEQQQLRHHPYFRKQGKIKIMIFLAGIGLFLTGSRQQTSAALACAMPESVWRSPAHFSLVAALYTLWQHVYTKRLTATD